MIPLTLAPTAPASFDRFRVDETGVKASALSRVIFVPATTFSMMFVALVRGTPSTE